MPLDPEAVQFLEQVRGETPIWELSIAENRARVGLLPSPAPDVAATRDLELPLPGGTIGGRVYSPFADNDPCPVIVFFHGGGWVMGSIDSHDHLARALCRECAATVLSVDYRLAPEHPFPAAADDAYNATVWAAANLAKGQPLLVAGDSAGGNLAAVTAISARDRGGPKLALQILIYPIVDCRFDTPSYSEHGEGLNLSRRDMEFFWDQYCPDVVRRFSQQASPMQTFDLTRLPPTIVIAAGHDPLYSEGLAYARRLYNAGVNVHEIDCPGMVHGFLRRIGSFQKAREVVATIGTLVRNELESR